MRLFKSRGDDDRRWSRRLVDEETYDFVHDVLDETSEGFRTASGEFQLRGLCMDVFAGVHTADVRWLKSRGVDGATFYRRELAPSWEGLDQHARADKIDQFIQLSHMLGGVELDAHPPDEVLAWSRPSTSRCCSSHGRTTAPTPTWTASSTGRSSTAHTATD